jgi:hypothetical protein
VQPTLFTLLASTVLAALLGSSVSTFGVEICYGSATLGPTMPDVSSAATTPDSEPAGQVDSAANMIIWVSIYFS